MVTLGALALAGDADARPARPAPPLPPPQGTVVAVSTEAALQAAVRSLRSHTTIVVAPGRYVLTSTLSISGPLTNVGIRGATGNSDDVVLVGGGMTNASVGSVPFGIWTGQGVDGVTIANVTIRDFYHHPIIFNAGTDRPHVYNVRLVDAGEQFIKSNPDAAGTGASRGIVEYSIIEFSERGRNDYPKGIDVHGGADWIIRHNLFRNLVAPAGQVMGPGVLIWRGSSGTITEGNTFINCARGIMYGADDHVSPSHRGGIIRNNMFFRAGSQPGDVGILLSDSPATEVLHNTVFVSGTYRTPIEYRYAGTRGVLIANNLVDGVIQARDGGTATLIGNDTRATAGMFVDAAAGDLHLSAAAAIHRGERLANAGDDWDGDARPADGGVDVGADERVAPREVKAGALCRGIPGIRGGAQRISSAPGSSASTRTASRAARPSIHMAVRRQGSSCTRPALLTTSSSM
jgi:hypothetical protein